MRVIAILGALVAAITAGIAGYWYGHGTGQRGKHQAAAEYQGGSADEGSGGDQSDELRRQLAQLERKVAALGAKEIGEKAKANADDESQKPTPNEHVSAAEQAERDRVAWETHIAKVDANFQAEMRDPRWATTTTELLRQRAAGDKVVGAALKDIDCRSTVCRVDMLDDQKGEFARKLPIFLQGVSNIFPLGQARTVDNPDGTKSLSFYLSTKAGEGAGASGG
jgi:hypothetical protein